jgi:hypothetical protein
MICLGRDGPRTGDEIIAGNGTDRQKRPIIDQRKLIKMNMGDDGFRVEPLANSDSLSWCTWRSSEGKTKKQEEEKK